MTTLAERGPFLNAALLCEQISEDHNHLLSLSRIINEIAVSNFDPTTQGPITIQLYALVSLVAGSTRGSVKVDFQLVQPSGKATHITQVYTAGFVEDASVRNIPGVLNIQTNEEGQHWIDVLVNEKRMTRMPLLVIFQPTSPENLSQ